MQETKVLRQVIFKYLEEDGNIKNHLIKLQTFIDSKFKRTPYKQLHKLKSMQYNLKNTFN